MLGSFGHFWDRNPSLLLGLSALLGTAASLQSPLLFALIFLPLLISAQKRRRIAVSAAFFIAAFASTPLRNPPVTLPQEKAHGTGIFTIDTLTIQTSPFHRSLCYRGTLATFTTEEGTCYFNLPCCIFQPIGKNHPAANCHYAIEGILMQKKEDLFLLKPTKGNAWIPQPKTHSFAEWRYQTKRALVAFLKTKITSAKAHHLLAALATGEIDERILKMEFGKVGLQHILAISGFHFACIALFLFFLLRQLLPPFASKIGLLILLSLCFFFLGNAPSILRAYIAIFLFTLGSLCGKKITGLNALGVALLVEICIAPRVIRELSFQLSFLCTFAILLFYPPLLFLMERLFPKRSSDQLLRMRFLDQHIYLIIAFLRKTLALNLAVHLISLPILLHLFHKFPLLSIAYNLIFPLCISLSMLLLCAALLLSPLLPFLSDPLYALNSAWTSALLQFTSHPPAALDWILRSNQVSFPFILCFLSLALFGAILFQDWQREQRLLI